MLTPFRQDTNSLYLTAGLNELGVSVAFKTIVGDNLDTSPPPASRHRPRRHRHLLRRPRPHRGRPHPRSLAEALELRLRRERPPRPPLQALRRAPHGHATQQRQAGRPPRHCAEILDNPNGSAPGQYIDTVIGRHRKIIILLPGPPKELKRCTKRNAVRASPPPFRRATGKRLLRMALIPESQSTPAPPPSTSSSLTSRLPSSPAPAKSSSTSSVQTHRSRSRKPVSTARRKSRSRNGRSRLLPHTANPSKRSSSSCLASATYPRRRRKLHRRPARPAPHLPSPAARATSSAAPSSTPTASRPPSPKSPNNLSTTWPRQRSVARAMAEGIRRRTGSILGVGITGIAGPGPGARPRRQQAHRPRLRRHLLRRRIQN